MIRIQKKYLKKSNINLIYSQCNNNKEGEFLVNQIQVTYKFNIDQIAGKHDTHNICIDYDGNLILLATTKIGQNYYYKIFHVTEWGIHTIIIPPSQESFYYVQPLGNNWLLVNARTDNEESHNAFVYDENQNMLSSFHMGDGIEDVQTTKNGEIWASYFDEGVFGNSIGASGLLCFDKNGAVIFDFTKFAQTPNNNDIPFIEDCYALNVFSNETVYLYYYSDFPLLALHNRTNYELLNDDLFRKYPIEGSKAFSVWKDFILFGHGYNHESELHLYSIKNKTLQSFIPVNKENAIINYDYAIGRKQRLFLIYNNSVYHLNIKDMLE